VLIHSLSQEYPDADFYGVEPTPNFCDLANRRTKAHVVRGYYSRSIFPNHKFDLVTCCQVFEHVKDLKKFVQDLKTNLSPNSKFLLEVPSTKDFEILNPSHSRFCEPSHLWYFSDSFLAKLFTEYGFEEIVSRIEKTVRGRMNLSMIFNLKDS
jgi:2-polyprenyl-3-methyl-5-hydroxy-6-metoxy-1,4-benzoquinol methylase